MTSNIGSPIIQRIAEEGGAADEMVDAVQDVLKTKFLPEFLNRIDETIVFEPLKQTQIHDIVKLQLKRLEKQLAANHMDLEVTDRAIDAIADEGFDPAFGARPLKRVIQRRIQNALATELLRGEIPEGSTIEVDYQNEDFLFRIRKEADKPTHVSQ